MGVERTPPRKKKKGMVNTWGSCHLLLSRDSRVLIFGCPWHGGSKMDITLPKTQQGGDPKKRVRDGERRHYLSCSMVKRPLRKHPYVASKNRIWIPSTNGFHQPKWGPSLFGRPRMCILTREAPLRKVTFPGPIEHTKRKNQAISYKSD